MKLSHYPSLKTSSSQAFWTPSNIIIIGGAIAVFITSSVTICSAIFTQTSSLSPISTQESPEQYATSLPWLQNKSDCENTERIWSKGKCWDSEHNLLF
jgi:hypothetical protein